LRQQLRSSDVIGRLGGEEFVAVLPETDVAAALVVIDRIRAQFAHVQHMGATSTPFAVTFSAGIAGVEPLAASEHVLALADGALYGAKQRGRNCVLCADALRSSQAPPAQALTQAPVEDGYSGGREKAVEVLVVDDDADMRVMLQQWLEEWGWQVTTAPNGGEAMVMLEHRTPDVILLDALMPGLGGLDLLAHIRARALEVGVVMVTGFSSEQLVLSALRYGADDYVRKPLDPVELRTAIERTLGRLHLRRETSPL
jgi:PleD family two-component response regulator